MKIKSIILKIIIKIKEKKYNCFNNKKIKYLLFKNQSNKLVVVFSGFPDQMGQAKYNYIRALKNVKANKLFILDDFGYKNKGSYYLGENGDLTLNKYIIDLINKVKQDNKIEKIYTLGSSKGGYAAIYYGTLIDADTIIAGAPQYFIADYLSTSDYHKKILSGIIGKSNKKKEYINFLLKNTIENSNTKSKYLLHYSKKEHTYNEHIKYMINDLKNSGKQIIENIGNYNNHVDVGPHMVKLIQDFFESEI